MSEITKVDIREEYVTIPSPAVSPRKLIFPHAVLTISRCPKSMSATYSSMMETSCIRCQVSVLTSKSRIASFDRKIHLAVSLSP